MQRTTFRDDTDMAEMPLSDPEPTRVPASLLLAHGCALPSSFRVLLAFQITIVSDYRPVKRRPPKQSHIFSSSINVVMRLAGILVRALYFLNSLIPSRPAVKRAGLRRSTDNARNSCSRDRQPRCYGWQLYAVRKNAPQPILLYLD
jgi:hypothetical protein